MVLKKCLITNLSRNHLLQFMSKYLCDFQWKLRISIEHLARCLVMKFRRQMVKTVCPMAVFTLMLSVRQVRALEPGLHQASRLSCLVMRTITWVKVCQVVESLLLHRRNRPLLRKKILLLEMSLSTEQPLERHISEGWPPNDFV